MDERRRSVIITVFSADSGIGKTVIATNFVAGLVQEGYSTYLIDLYLKFVDVCNYIHLQPQFTIADAQPAMKQYLQNFDVRHFLTLYQHKYDSFSMLTAPLTLDSSYIVEEPHVMDMIERMHYFDFIISPI